MLVLDLFGITFHSFFFVFRQFFTFFNLSLNFFPFFPIFFPFLSFFSNFCQFFPIFTNFFNSFRIFTNFYNFSQPFLQLFSSKNSFPTRKSCKKFHSLQNHFYQVFKISQINLRVIFISQVKYQKNHLSPSVQQNVNSRCMVQLCEIGVSPLVSYFESKWKKRE